MDLDMCLVKIVVEVYAQQKTYIKYLVVVWLRLLFKMLFTWKCIKIIYFYFKKIIFDISASKWFKNTKKNINLKQIKKRLSIFFKSAFETQKQTVFYETQLKKHVKTVSRKLRFKLNFLVCPAV